jgi:hypothetical protein
MNALETGSTNAREENAHSISSPSAHPRPPATNCNERLAELEIENSRLHRLVAELLIKNQQLRKSD